MSAPTLDDFKWDKRLILIKIKESEKLIVEALKEDRAEIEERDIFWFLIDSDSLLNSNYSEEIEESLLDSINDHFSKGLDKEVVLIGKDGGVKARSAELELDELYRLIDSMPMRQAEMRR